MGIVKRDLDQSQPDQAWSDELILALRLRDVPGARIGEVLAEVQSHVAETGEESRAAFGDPKAYAAEVAGALGLPRSGIRALLGSLTAVDVALTVVLGLAGYFLADALWDLGAGDRSWLGLPAWVVALVAALAMAGCAAHFTATTRRQPDVAVRDPRTGADMVPFAPWRVAVLVGYPVLVLVAALVGGYLTR
jgi:hypothetical protein